MYFLPLKNSSIVMIDEQQKAKKSSMPHKKKKPLVKFQPMILNILKIWGIYDIISYVKKD